MAIKVIFKDGETNKTVNGLYQWDYGQVIEIEAVDLPTIVELHFACTNMDEALVRVCNVENGMARTTIPDVCLEQSTPLTVWVYEIDGAHGHTSKTVTLPIVARKRPSTTSAPIQEHTDQYTELISEVNDAIDHLKSGEIVVEKANNAGTSTYSISSGQATQAEKATKDGDGNDISDTYVKWSDGVLTTKNPVTVAQGGTGATDPTQARKNLGTVHCANQDDGFDARMGSCKTHSWVDFYEGTIKHNSMTLGLGMTKFDKPVNVESGGTGATDEASARRSLGANNASNIDTGTLSADRLPVVPITKGGTGATSESEARVKLAVPSNADLEDGNIVPRLAHYLSPNEFDTSYLPNTGLYLVTFNYSGYVASSLIYIPDIYTKAIGTAVCNSAGGGFLDESVFAVYDGGGIQVKTSNGTQVTIVSIKQLSV